ncbi:MAG TPA: ROK family protein [Dehalococcoidia bacterium]|nr:ROK family protein [Dehalococcoidia bacterium]
MTETLAGAIDLGGTKILTAVVASSGEVRSSDRIATRAGEGPDAVCEEMVASLRRACGQAGTKLDALTGIGVSAAGPLDAGRGVLTEPPNLPGWKDVPLGRMLHGRCDLRVVLENDANAAALGEFVFGAGRGTRDMVYITVSTGVGGGVVCGGRLYRGASGAAGEIGHMTIAYRGERCGCGRAGCLEAYASGTAIAREGRHAAESGGSPALAAQAAGGQAIDAEAVARAAEAGDAAAAAILARAAEYLGVGLMNTVHLFNPELIVLGGGVSNLRARVIEPAIAFMRDHAFPTMAGAVRVAYAARGDEAPVLGAAALVLPDAERGA